MILETAILLCEERREEFEHDLKLVDNTSVWLTVILHSLRKCVEHENKYLLLVDCWNTISSALEIRII
jgi:hypothetical protein